MTYNEALAAQRDEVREIVMQLGRIPKRSEHIPPQFSSSDSVATLVFSSLAALCTTDNPASELLTAAWYFFRAGELYGRANAEVDSLERMLNGEDR